MRDRLWTALILALLCGLLLGWQLRSWSARNACQASGGHWYGTANACAQVRAGTGAQAVERRSMTPE